MRRVAFLISINLLVLGCNRSTNQQFTGLFGGTITPGAPSLANNSFPTSSAGGYFTILSTQLETIPSGFAIVGFAADSKGQYRNLAQFDNSGFEGTWQIQELPLGSSTWTTICSDGGAPTQLGSGWSLAVDSSNFYIFTKVDSGNNIYQVTEFSRSTCTSQGTLNLSSKFSIENGQDIDFAASVYNGTLYYTVTNGGGAPWPTVEAYIIGSSTSSSLQAGTSFSDQTLAAPNSLLVAGGNMWAIERGYLWKLDLSGNILAWASLPEQSYADLTYPAGLALNSNGNLIVLTQNGTAIDRITVDISNF